jgi:hypothetical protein
VQTYMKISRSNRDVGFGQYGEMVNTQDLGSCNKSELFCQTLPR